MTTTEPAVGRRSLLRATLRLRQVQIGVVILLGVVAVAVIGPWVAPHSPTEFVGIPFTGRSGDAFLGTDYLGRDVLSRVLYGGRSVIWMALAAGTLGVLIGAAVGLLAGYTGGRFDSLVMRALDVLTAFPQLVLLVLFVSMLGPSKLLIVVLVAIAWIPGVARVTRGITTTLVTREYVEACEVMGYSRASILAGEVLPNLAGPLLVEYGLRVTWSIAVIAAASFLGLGVQAPTADWGLMINENRDGLIAQPWAVAAPVIMIALFTVGANLIADGLGQVIAGDDVAGAAR